MLAPLVKREILWRLITGEQGGIVRQLGLADSSLSHVARSVRWIREHYAQPFKVEDVAQLAGMSVSAFYRNFQAVTAMSPIQFQKQIRLQEARLLLATHPNDVTAVGHRVGYDSASQFSREYRRQFGAPRARTPPACVTPRTPPRALFPEATGHQGTAGFRSCRTGGSGWRMSVPAMRAPKRRNGCSSTSSSRKTSRSASAAGEDGRSGHGRSRDESALPVVRPDVGDAAVHALDLLHHHGAGLPAPGQVTWLWPRKWPTSWLMMSAR